MKTNRNDFVLQNKKPKWNRKIKKSKSNIMIGWQQIWYLATRKESDEGS